jgi:hypothetical protein
MKRVSVTLALVVGLVGMVLFSGCRFLGLSSKYPGKYDVDVYVEMNAGLCQVRGPVETLGGKKNQQITWLVHNVDCNIPQYVTFDDYKPYLVGGGYGPVDHTVVVPDLATSGPIARTRDEKVKAAIDKEAKNDKDIMFKYRICTGPFPNPTMTCLDPDVDVWPF